MSFEWKTLTLGELGRVVTGKTPKTAEAGNFGGDIPFVTPTDMDDRKEISATSRYLTTLGATSVKNSVIPAGAVMVSCIGSDMGKSAIAGHKCVTNQQINSLVVDAAFCNQFVYYNLSMRKEELQDLASSGSTMPILNKGNFSEIEIDLPPLRDQVQIAEILSNLDDRITLLRETNATLEAIAQALFKSWFVDFDPVRAKMEGRVPEGMDEATAALFPDALVESELGLVPKGWATVPIYDMATFINGAAYKAFEPSAERRGRPIIKIAELKSGVTAQTAYSNVTMPAKYLIETGDILFSWSGNPDTSIDTFVWNFEAAWLNQHIFRVLPRAPHERAFTLQMLRHLKPVFTELARNKQTTGLGHVTVADMKRERIAMPTEELLRQFDLVGGPIQTRIFENERQAQTLATLRDTLLPRLISGQLRLPEAQAAVEEALA